MVFTLIHYKDNDTYPALLDANCENVLNYTTNH
jgi:hypothetical protein